MWVLLWQFVCALIYVLIMQNALCELCVCVRVCHLPLQFFAILNMLAALAYISQASSTLWFPLWTRSQSFIHDFSHYAISTDTTHPAGLVQDYISLVACLAPSHEKTPVRAQTGVLFHWQGCHSPRYMSINCKKDLETIILR